MEQCAPLRFGECLPSLAGGDAVFDIEDLVNRGIHLFSFLWNCLMREIC